MRVAVTGASGKVGKFVVQDLLNNNYEVLALNHRNWPECPAEQISLDILDYDKVFESLKGCQAVIHLAAIPAPMKDDNSRVFQTNLVGTYNIVLAAGMLGIRHVAAASSDCALGFTWNYNRPDPVYLPVDEEHPARPDNGYGISKLLSEKTCDAMAQRFPWMSIASLRITYVAAPEEYNEGSYFSNWIKNPESGPWNLWSYIDARDSAAAFRLAVESDLNGHEVFYIAASNTRSLIPSSELINRYFPDAELKQQFNGHESLENSSKAERLLGFKPKYRWDRPEGI